LVWSLGQLVKIQSNLGYIGLYCWNMSGSSQSLRFKKMYYTALLNQ